VGGAFAQRTVRHGAKRVPIGHFGYPFASSSGAIGRHVWQWTALGWPAQRKVLHRYMARHKARPHAAFLRRKRAPGRAERFSMLQKTGVRRPHAEPPPFGRHKKDPKKLPPCV